jgi:hypothetical protein
LCRMESAALSSPGRLAVPAAGDTGEPAPRQARRPLGPCTAIAASSFIDGVPENDVVRGEQIAVPLQLEVVAGERRTFIAADEAGCRR